MPQYRRAVFLPILLSASAQFAFCVSTYTCTAVPISGLTSPVTGLFPLSINNQEQVAAMVGDQGFVGNRGFVIDNTGTAVPYTQPSNGTVILTAVNNVGQVAGWAGDPHQPWYPLPFPGGVPPISFISNQDQSLTLIDPPPDTPTQSFDQIRIASINDNGDTLGEITALAQNATAPTVYWFIRNAAGIYTLFDPHTSPGIEFDFFGSIQTVSGGSINSSGTAILDGRLRTADGSEKPISMRAGNGPPWGWFAINNRGYIAGNFTRYPYTMPFSVVLSPDGNAPVAICPENNLNSAVAFSINDNGVLAATQYLTTGIILMRPTGYQSGLELSNQSWGFSPSPVGVQGGTGTIYLNSRGDADLRIQLLGIEARDANDSPADFMLSRDGTTCVDMTDVGGGTLVQTAKTFAPGEFCSISFTFKPRGVGSRTAQIVIFDDAPDAPHVIRLEGMGLGKRNLVFSNNYWDFGAHPVGQTTTAATLYVYNPGTDDINVSSLALSGPNASDFQVTGNGCAAAISAYTTCTIKFAFAPAAVGFKNATLMLTDDSPVHQITIPVSGYAY